MARKNILQGLMAEATGAAGDKAPSPAPQQRSGGAIGAVSKSIEELKRRSVNEIDPRMVDDGGLRDRIDQDDADLDKLMESLKEYGQQVPVLLRVNPNDPERYQVVYGRRRVAAMKRLGLPVKALIRDLDDRALVIAQGQENTARKELTFIEKANFAQQMRDAGYDRKVICDALSIDKTVISRMLQVVDTVPAALIKAIGSAPAYGRDRWLALADALQGRDMLAEAKGASSDARFAAVMAALKTPRPAAPAPQPVRNAKGETIGQLTRRGQKLTVTLDAQKADGFDDWLAQNIETLHRDWLKTRES